MGCDDAYGSNRNLEYIPVPSRKALLDSIAGDGAMVRFGCTLALEITLIRRTDFKGNHFEIEGTTLDKKTVTGTIYYATTNSGSNRAHLDVKEAEEE